MRKGLFIGTSGWSYRDDWRDIFYDNQTPLLFQYLTYFDTAEINSTFYALPRRTFVAHLTTGTPRNKFFTVKMPKAITHKHRLRIAGEGSAILRDFFAIIRPLGSRIAAVLIQLPPWSRDDMGDLEAFLNTLPTDFRYAVEFREESWLSSDVSTLLEEYGIANVIVDEPRLPVDMRLTTDFAYIRWHGHGRKPWYDYRYSREELEGWVPRLRFVMEQTDTVLGYFNNHYHGNAPLNALQMLDLLGMATDVQRTKLARMLEYMSIQQMRLTDF